MNCYTMIELAEKNGGEYVLGSADLHTHACYFIYGILQPEEKGRLLKPGKGHEEIVCMIQGEAVLCGEKETFVLREGHAFHIRGEETLSMDNTGTGRAVYVIAGGHSEPHPHQYD